MFATYAYTGVPARTWRQKLDAVAPALAAAGGFGAACVLDLINDPTQPGNGTLPICPSKLLFGIDCPGCGGQRMLYSLLHGDVVGALHYNAVSLVFLLMLLWALVASTLGRLRGQWRPTWINGRWTPKIVMGVFIAWFVIRNLPFAPFTSLYV